MMETDNNLLFIGGDISGIQKFIYSISSKKAMVSLKGRSAYLDDYTRNLCNGILDLPVVLPLKNKKIIYCSGGKFYLIIDDNPSVRESIDHYYYNREELLWKEHYGQLGLAIAYVPFRITDGKIIVNGKSYDTIGVLWDRITESFSRLKSRKFQHIISNNFDSYFEPIPVGGKTKICAISGIESPDCVMIESDSEDEPIWVLPSVRHQVEIGINLRNKEHFKTLEDYAERQYLGVLRMDVDNLGARFIKGFSDFSEYNSFSNSLSQFMGSTLAQIQKKYDEHLNIVYSGGDDLFAVGRWDKIIDFASDVHDEFVSRFFKKEGLTISGGVAIVGPKFPISKAAELAGEAESLAKSYHNNSKDAFSLFGDCVSWQEEFPIVRNLKDELIHQITFNAVPKGVLHQLIHYANLALDSNSINFKWHETYYFTRAIERCASNNYKAKDFLAKLRKDSITRTKENYRLIRLAARWAEILLRLSENNK